MKLHSKIISILGLCVFMLGILLSLALSGWILWGEVEAIALVPRSASRQLKTLECPWMIASDETGSVTATFDNPTDEAFRPTIRTYISSPNETSLQITILPVVPGEVKELSWSVNVENMTFGRLILVNIYESSQHDFLSHQASCVILVSPLPGIPGKQAFLFVYAFSLLSIVSGAVLWVMGNSPLRGMAHNVGRAGMILTIVVLMDAACALFRWWGLNFFLCFVALMMIAVAITQFLFFPSADDRTAR